MGLATLEPATAPAPVAPPSMAPLADAPLADAPPAADAGRRPSLRLLTAGSVDDGKSTLIGRLLLDSRSLLADQLQALTQRAAGAPPDLALLTDGLEAEREQGITIDVAWRYFTTPRRKFVIADSPGHEQYTRNMVTAAAGSDVAVVLVDITKLPRAGEAADAAPRLLAQTRRHALLARLLRVPALVFAVNKLDALGEAAPAAFAALEGALQAFAREADLPLRAVVPISALRGDNVVLPSAHWPWYRGATLLATLEGLEVAEEARAAGLRLPVQYLARESADHPGAPQRVIWGRIAQGRVQAGDTVTLLPSGQVAKVAEVRQAGERVAGCEQGQSAGLVLDRHVDVSRGDWVVSGPAAAQAPAPAAEFDRFSATLAWLDVEPAVIGRRYWLRHGHRWVQARISAIAHRLDIDTLRPQDAPQLGVNDIGTVTVQLQQPLPLLPYAQNRVAGAAILVDAASHRTSGALLVTATPNGS